MIHAEHLKKSFQGRLVFENVTFDIPAGCITGVYGASGIGKSTLAKLLCGILKPDEGEIFLDGTLLSSPRSRYDRKRGVQIQMVYQQPYAALDGSQKLLDGFYELIRYHRFAQNRAEADRLLDSLMAEVGLDREILNHLPRQISGGEAQRAAIAKCLLFRPQLLILDEATSMLDVSTQANVLALVRHVMEQSGGSILLISHDRELVEHLCNQIYLFENHHLKEEQRT